MFRQISKDFPFSLFISIFHFCQIAKKFFDSQKTFQKIFTWIIRPPDSQKRKRFFLKRAVWAKAIWSESPEGPVNDTSEVWTGGFNKVINTPIIFQFRRPKNNCSGVVNFQRQCRDERAWDESPFGHCTEFPEGRWTAQYIDWQGDASGWVSSLRLQHAMPTYEAFFRYR